MSAPERPDLRRLRHHLGWLVAVIVVVVIGFLTLTLYLYQHFTAGVTVTP